MGTQRAGHLGLWATSVPEGTYVVTASLSGKCPVPVADGKQQPVASVQIIADVSHQSEIQNIQFLSSSPAAPDLDGDCDVDVEDLSAFDNCTSGPGILHSGTPTCLGADFNTDNDVDQADFATFQRCFSGPDVPANPNCAD